MRLIAILMFLWLAGPIPLQGATMEVSLSPEHPKPGERVTLTVSDFSGDRATTAYIWSADGKTIAQGIGLVSISRTAGNIGSSEDIAVRAVENGRARGTASVTIRSASVDILWEGETDVPPLYPGRPLPNGKSSVRVFAVPHLSVAGRELGAAEAVYRWSVDGSPVTRGSEYGKASAVITPPRFGAAFTVSVEASSRDGSVTGVSSVIIQPQTPTAVIYENAPLLGMRFDRALRGLVPFPNAEISFVAYPLFVMDANEPSYVWQLDGKPFDVNPDDPRAVTFRKVGTGTGRHLVSLSFQNRKNFLEEGRTEFGLTF